MASFVGPMVDGRVTIDAADGNITELSDLIDELDGESVVVQIKDGDKLTFKTQRERRAWCDGVRQGARMASEPDTILKWFEAWLRSEAATDSDDKDFAVEQMHKYAGQLSESGKERARCLVQNIQSWTLGLGTKHSGKANECPSTPGFTPSTTESAQASP